MGIRQVEEIGARSYGIEAYDYWVVQKYNPYRVMRIHRDRISTMVYYKDQGWAIFAGDETWDIENIADAPTPPWPYSAVPLSADVLMRRWPPTWNYGINTELLWQQALTQDERVRQWLSYLRTQTEPPPEPEEPPPPGLPTEPKGIGATIGSLVFLGVGLAAVVAALRSKQE